MAHRVTKTTTCLAAVLLAARAVQGQLFPGSHCEVETQIPDCKDLAVPWDWKACLCNPTCGMGGGGDPYVNVAGKSLFLDAPPRSDVEVYGRPGGVNVTLAMNDDGLYFAEASIAWAQHMLTVEPRIIGTGTGAAAEATVTLDGVSVGVSKDPFVVGGVKLTVSPSFVDIDALDTLAKESFRIFAAENSAKMDDDEEDEVSAHIDFFVNNAPSKLFGSTHLPPASGLLAKTFAADMRLKSRRQLLDEGDSGCCECNPVVDPECLVCGEEETKKTYRGKWDVILNPEDPEGPPTDNIQDECGGTDCIFACDAGDGLSETGDVYCSQGCEDTCADALDDEIPGLQDAINKLPSGDVCDKLLVLDNYWVMVVNADNGKNYPVVSVHNQGDQPLGSDCAIAELSWKTGDGTDAEGIAASCGPYTIPALNNCPDPLPTCPDTLFSKLSTIDKDVSNVQFSFKCCHAE